MNTREQLAEVIRDGEGTWRTPLEAADAILPLFREARAAELEAAAEGLDGDDLHSFYITRKRELSAPYSKPMLPEQWGELDGIESAGKWLHARAAVIRDGEV